MSSTNNIPRNIPNPLLRDGTSQDARLLEALQPSNIKIDGKGIEDWLHEAHAYAKLLRYYNQDNQVQGDWTDFIEKDISYLISLINEQKPGKLRKDFLEKLGQLAVGDSDGNTALITELLLTLKDYGHQIFLWFDGSEHELEDEGVKELFVHTELKRLIPSVIDDGYTKLLAWLEEGEKKALPFSNYPNGRFHLALFEEQWPQEPVTGDYLPLADGVPIDEESIADASKMLKALYDLFFEVHVNIYGQAEKFMTNSLEDFPAHQAHMTLFIACLRIFQITQTALNELTEEHLDFYYQEVLKLDFRAEIEDKVHLVFELAQNFVNAEIKEDRILLAGKDEDNEDLFYATDNELIVNEAQLDEEIGLKSLFIDKDYQRSENGEISGFEFRNIHGAPDADSEDGLGEDLLSPDKQWHTFGTNDVEKTPHAEIGFAIASPMLLLGEGSRKIEILFEFANLLDAIVDYERSVMKSELENNVKIFLSGEKEWIEVSNKTVDIQNDLIYTLELSQEEDAVVPYNNDELEDGFNTELPVVKFVLDNEGLSTLGDIDLNLAADIAEFDEETLYFPGEFVKRSEAGVRNVFRANGEFLGSESDDLNPFDLSLTTSFLWEKADFPADVILHAPGNTYFVGDVVQLVANGPTFLARAETNTSPDVSIKFWISFSEDSYEENVLYTAGTIVSFSSELWLATTNVVNSEPADDNPDWQKIEEFDPDISYPAGAIAVVENTHFRASTATQGDDPRLETLIFSRIDGVIPFDINDIDEYSKNDIVRKIDSGEAHLFQLNTLSTDLQPVRGETELNKVWVEITANVYEGNTALKGDIVEFEGSLFEHNAIESDIPPSENSPLVWEPQDIHAFSLSSGIVFTKNILVESGGELFRLNALSPDVNPDSGSPTKIWEERLDISPYTGGHGKDDIVDRNNQLFRQQAITTSRAPDNNASIWIPQAVANYSLGTHEIGDIVFFAGDSQLYQQIVENSAQTADPPDSTQWVTITDSSQPLIIDPSLSSTIDEGRYVKITGSNQYYLANAENDSLDDFERMIWTEEFGGGSSLIIYPASGTTEVQIKNIAKYQSKYYQANADNDVVPTSDADIWELLDTVDTGYSEGDTVEANKFIELSNSYFLSTAKNDLSPLTNAKQVWTHLTPPGNGLNIFSNNEFPRVEKDAFVKFEAKYYQAQEATEGISPADLDATVWTQLTTNPVTTYPDTHPLIQQDEYIQYAVDNQFYLVNTPVEGVDPSAGNKIWDPITTVNSYNPIISYKRGDLAIFQGSLFQAQAGFRDVSPASNLTIWSEFDAENIPAFDPNTFYRTGSYVSSATGIFKSLAGTSGVPPEENVPIWQFETELREFSAQDIYNSGEYVIFNGVTYRALSRVIGVLPDLDPTKWRVAGKIVLYDPDLEYQINMHVRGRDNQVYRALKHVPVCIFPDEDSDQSREHWVEVQSSYAYKYFQDLELNKLDISVVVKGLKNLILENDQGIIDPAKPFQPFGSFPKRGENFYIGSHEIFQKRLSGIDEEPNLELEITWGDLPEVNFATYYNFYVDEAGVEVVFDPTDSSIVVDNQYFKAGVSVRQDGDWVDVPTSDSQKQLFLNEGNPDPVINNILVATEVVAAGKIEEGDIKPLIPLTPIPAPEKTLSLFDILEERDPDLASFSVFSQSSLRGFLRLSLITDFFHGNYATSLAKEAVKIENVNIPNAPYTPTINELVVNYASQQTISFKGKKRSDLENRVERFFHIHPFGQTEFLPIVDDKQTQPVASPFLVPTFDVEVRDEEGDKSGKFEASAGTLFIGIKDVKPLQTISLLFQVAESSENPETEQEQVIWSYLEHNRWIDFPSGGVINDTTNGLLTSGIIQFAMPRKIIQTNTILPEGLFWIKASVVGFADSVAKMISIHTQAVQASYQAGENNSPNHLANPLPAKTISQLQERLASIKSITQPYASFGGRVKEQQTEFYRRVSERLRHKGRGINIFDIERLVLEEFPELYKVKCLNHTTDDIVWKKDDQTDAEVLFTREHSPGSVKVVVVPNLRNKNAVNPLQPRASKNTLSRIREFLQKRMSEFVHLEVSNPVFEEVMVSARIVFKAGKDKAFFLNKLNEDIKRLLSPWLFDEGADLSFTSNFHQSVILAYMDGLDYIDFVVDMSLTHRVTLVDENLNEFQFVEEGLEEIQPGSGSSVLVSVEQHDLKAILEESLPCLDDPVETLETTGMKNV